MWTSPVKMSSNLGDLLRYRDRRSRGDSSSVAFRLGVTKVDRGLMRLTLLILMVLQFSSQLGATRLDLGLTRPLISIMMV